MIRLERGPRGHPSDLFAILMHLTFFNQIIIMVSMRLGTFCSFRNAFHGSQSPCGLVEQYVAPTQKICCCFFCLDKAKECGVVARFMQILNARRPISAASLVMGGQPVKRREGQFSGES